MSGIVIPMSDVGSPRAAAPRVEEDPSGRIAADFGAHMTQVGEALETDRLDREMARTRIDIQRGLGQAAQELRGIGDPEALDAGWVERSKALREQTLANVNPRNRARAELAFDEVSDSHALSLGARALDLRQSQSRALLDEQAYTVVSGAATADPQTRQTAYDQLADSVAEQQRNGTITPERAGEILRSAKAEAERAAVTGALDTDPDSVLAALDKGDYAGLDPIYREGVKSTARARIATRQAQAEAEAARQAAASERAIDERLDTVIGNARDGRVNTWEADLLSDPAVQARPKYFEAKAAIDLRNALPQFASLPPARQVELIAAEKAKPVTERYETRLLTAMEEANKAAVSAWSADPIATASKVGLTPPAELPDVAAAAPADLAKAFAERRGYGLSLQKQGYVEKTAFFSVAERARLAEATASTRDPAARAQLAASFVAAFGSDAPRALAEVGGDDVFLHMGSLAAVGGNPGLAATAFEGQRMLDQKLVELPKQDERRLLADEVLGDLFAGDSQTEGQILRAADAIYAAGARGVDPDDGSEMYRQAIQAALGAGATGRNATMTGGVQEVHGTATLLPVRVTAAEVEASLDRVAERLDSHGDAIWRKVSAGGGVPLYAGTPVTASQLGGVRLRAVGNDLYSLSVMKRGGEFDLTDSKTGAPFTLRLSTFLKEAGR